MIEKGNNILVPIDFEEQSSFALDYAVNLSKFTGLRLILVLVREERSILSKVFSEDQEKLVFDALKSKLRELAETTADECEVKVDYEMLKGSVHERIIDYAEEKVSKLIVMGKGSRYIGTKAEHPVIGSTTSKVISYSKTPVISVGSPYHNRNIRTIMLPLDLSKETRQKVNWAIEMAKLFNSKIRIVSAVEGSYTEVDVDKIFKQAKQVEDFINKHNVDCSSEILKASKDAKSFVPMLLKYAEEHDDIDLSLIMTHQENAFKQFLLGSTAANMVRRSSFPIMTIVPKQLESYYIA
jgi:nucleotide-binding universal stress UspA family protein